MKAVMKSVSPRICEKVANGDCTILVSKTAPKCEEPFKCYIYCVKEKKQDDIIWAGVFGDRGKWNGKVIGEFVCDKVYKLFPFGMGTGIELLDELILPEMFCKESCLTEQEICDYIGEKDGYGWHISDLKIYGKPKELSEFFTPMGKRPSYMVERPPQSYMYVEEI